MDVPGGQKAEGGKVGGVVDGVEVVSVMGRGGTVDVVGRPKVGVTSKGSCGRGGSDGASDEEEVTAAAATLTMPLLPLPLTASSCCCNDGGADLLDCFVAAPGSFTLAGVLPGTEPP